MYGCVCVCVCVCLVSLPKVGSLASCSIHRLEYTLRMVDCDVDDDDSSDAERAKSTDTFG